MDDEEKSFGGWSYPVKRRGVLFLVASIVLILSCQFITGATTDTPEPEVTQEVVPNTPDLPTPISSAQTPTSSPQTSLIFQEDFASGEGEWIVEQLPEYSLYLSDEQYIIEVHEPLLNAYSEHSQFRLLDTYTLDVDISYLSGPIDSEAGIAFRCDVDDEAWVEFGFNADGFFSVSSVTYGEEQLEFTEIMPFALVPALRVGQSTNHIRLVDDDKQVTVFINDELVTTFSYEDLPPGCPSLFAGTYEEGGAKWAFDNVFIREIERSGGADVPAPITALARQVSSLTMQALRKAVGAPPLAQASTASVSLRPPAGLSLTQVSAALVSFRPPAAQTAYRVDCPVGGYMEMTELPDNLPFIGEVGFKNAVQVYKDCTYFEGDLQYTTNGTLTANGSYHIDEASPQNIRVAGQLATSPGEDCPVDGRVLADGVFAGTICAWPITIDPLPPLASLLTPAELLAGKWSGRANFIESSLGCSGPADFTFMLQGSGNNINGTYTYTIGSAIGPDPICSRSCSSGGVSGCMVSGSLGGTAQNGTINFTAGGLSVEGTYRHDGQWMGGHYQGIALEGFPVSGDWQTILR